ncbi:MAG: ABC-type transport auxiliary lipoprotein family protein [Pseudomonadota bacterium]
MTPVRTRFMLMALGAASLIAAPGCISVLPEAEPSTVYRLQTGLAMPPAPAPASETTGVVVVERPLAPRALAGDSVALRMADGRLAYMNAASWISPTPALLQDVILDTFQRTEPGVVAARSDDGVSSDYRLRVEVRRFEAAYINGDEAAPQVELVMTARLIHTGDRALTGVHTLRAVQNAASNRQGDIVEAFSAATTQVAEDLARWSAEQISSSEPGEQS